MMRMFIYHQELRRGLARKAFLGFVILISAVSCSKEPSQDANNTVPLNRQNSALAERPRPMDPSQIILVETAERKERLTIEAKAASFLAAKDFAGLENMANEYRASKACYPNGIWKLGSVYDGTYPKADKSDVEWNASLDTLRSWVQAKPDSVTARVALADALVSYAWKARGNGLANTVTGTGWKLFGEGLAEAVDVLKQAESLKQKCPYFWTVLLRAGTGSGVEKSRYQLLFEKATASEPDCIDYYCLMAKYLLPRWYGRAGEMETFARKAADQVGGDAGNIFYARLAWCIQGMGGNIFVEDGFSWERADRGFQILEKQYPDSLFVQNARAYIAVMGCEKTLAPRRLVEYLHGKIDTASWDSKENFIRLTKNLYPQ